MVDYAATGRRILTELQGPAFVQNKEKARNKFNAVLQDYSEEVCFGRIWAREGLPRKYRSIINIALLVALNRVGPLRNHIDGALNNGCTMEEIQEILLHTAVYVGLPAATEAFKIAEEVMKARKLLD